jgi:hypothetical protein
MIKDFTPPEFTGKSVSYYTVDINYPTSNKHAYTAECNDIIEALNMSYAEANVFKAVWRICAARTLGKKKKGHEDPQYDAEKIVFFADRIHQQILNIKREEQLLSTTNPAKT